MYQSHRVLGVWRGIVTQVITFSLFPGQARVMLGWVVPLELTSKGNGIRWCIWVKEADSLTFSWR